MEQERIGIKTNKAHNYGFLVKSFLIFSILATTPYQEYSMIKDKNNANKNLIKNPDIELKKQIIEEAIRKTLINLRGLESLPLEIHYFQDNIKDVPRRIDIIPKKIDKPINGITLILGGRSFFIEPLFGKIQSIRLTKEALELETTYLNKTYSKEQKLPELCYRLRSTPKGKGEKTGFMGSKITEI